MIPRVKVNQKTENGILRIHDKQGNLVAHVYDTNQMEGYIFPTSDKDFFQFGFSNNLEEKNLKAHIHKDINRSISKTSEFIFVLTGIIEIDVLSDNAEKVENVILTEGIGILQFTGGHKIKIHKETKYFEIKQGPYFGQDSDKVIL